MKMTPLAAELFHAEVQTDRHDEANSRFSKLCQHNYLIAFVHNEAIYEYTSQKKYRFLKSNQPFNAV